MSGVPRVALGDDGATTAALIVGGWQLSRGHRAAAVDEEALFEDLLRMARGGWTTFDCADIYTGVEELFGRFNARHAGELCADGIELQFHTKYVPDQDALATVTKDEVERTVDRSLSRLGVERLDLLQFAWWDYAVPGYVEAAAWLDELRAAGKLRHLGLTNFDTERTRELLDAGIPLVSNQVQYSLLDRRPEHGLVDLARERGLALLCYGALSGGFLSETYLGQPPPGEPLANRSLVKYRLIIEEAGGWQRYQEVLRTLAAIARRHDCSPSAVALSWLLARPAVAAAMVGTFDGRHVASSLGALSLSLTTREREELVAALAGLKDVPGDVFGLERSPGAPHSRILWKNLSRGQS